MPSRKNRKKRGKPSRESGGAAHAAMTKPNKHSSPRMEVSPPMKSSIDFTVDDFLFIKLFKSVNVVGKQTMNEVLQVIFRHKAEADFSSFTLHQLLTSMKIRNNKMTNIMTKLNQRVLNEKLPTVQFDITCAIYLLQNVFSSNYGKLSNHCQAQICSLKELRTSHSHNYPIECEPDDGKLNAGMERNDHLRNLSSEIRKLEDKIGIDVNEIKCMNEKKKEKHVITEIEKLRIILSDILEDICKMFEEDLTDSRALMDKNLTDIIKTKVQDYDQETYDKEVETFKKDPFHILVTSGDRELKQQYSKLRIANPCPWMAWEQAKKSSVVNFCIDKIYTPLNIEGPQKEINTEDLLETRKRCSGKLLVPPAMVVSGLAGSGKTSLCLYLLHHWAAGTQDIKMLKDFNLVIFVEMRKVRSNRIEDYLKMQRMGKSTENIPSDELVKQFDDLKLLFIIDGYDEGKKASKAIVDDIFAKFPQQRILVTTRGEFCQEVKDIAKTYKVDYLAVEIGGFDTSRIEEFSKKVFNVIDQSPYCTETQASKQGDSTEFISFVKRRFKVLEKLLELPLTLALMIYMWLDCPDALNRVTTCTSLYYELFCLYQKKLKGRLGHKSSLDDFIKNLLLLMGQKAWQLLIYEESVLSKDDEKEIEDQCRGEGIPKEEVMSAFLVHEYDDNAPSYRYEYSFLHKTQMEYLSAYYLAELPDKERLRRAIVKSKGSEFYQVVLFLVGHFARKKTLRNNLTEVLEFIDKVDIKTDDYNCWWSLVAESMENEPFVFKICKEKLSRGMWKLNENDVVSGLQLLSASPLKVEELVIEIGNSTDPYNIRDFPDIMNQMGEKLVGRYDKKHRIPTELFFWHHFDVKCARASNQLVRLLHSWGTLKNFVGSLEEQAKEKNEVFNRCIFLKNLRIRIDSCGAEKCLANNLKTISKSIRNLRVLLVLSPEECDPNTLVCLTSYNFKGDLELTLPNMKDEDKKWIVAVVKTVSGNHGCARLVLDKCALTFSSILTLIHLLSDVIQKKLTIDNADELSLDQRIKMEELQKEIHFDVNWLK